jgi:hypothetical protein
MSDLEHVIAALQWLLEKDRGSVSLMHKKKLESIKQRLKREHNLQDEDDVLPLQT